MSLATKPRYTLREGKPVMVQDVTPIAPANKFDLPAHLQGKPKVASWGDIDPKQRMLPRIKLLQASNPECVDYPGEAKAGEFWHTTLTTSLGAEIIGVPIMRRQTYNLWAPRGPNEDRGILARARDFIHWDPPEGEFHVRYPMNPKTYTWKLARTVKESGLAEFGSSRYDDPESPPAATLTFEVLWYLPDWNTLALTLNTRSGVKEAKRLFSQVDARPVSHFFQRYKIVAVQNRGPTGEAYYGYKYRGDGWTDAALSAITEPMFETWKDVAFTTADEDEEVDGEALARRRGAPPRDAMSERGARPVEPQGQAGVIDDDIPF
jgi:hypothetical protein